MAVLRRSRLRREYASAREYRRLRSARNQPAAIRTQPTTAVRDDGGPPPPERRPASCRSPGFGKRAHAGDGWTGFLAEQPRWGAIPPRAIRAAVRWPAAAPARPSRAG